jgi:hypothetical protein
MVVDEADKGRRAYVPINVVGNIPREAIGKMSPWMKRTSRRLKIIYIKKSKWCNESGGPCYGCLEDGLDGKGSHDIVDV